MIESAHLSGRSFLRHPVDIPIEIDADGSRHHQRAARRLKDIGLGGLACRSEQRLPVGARVLVTIPVVKPAFHAHCSVVWCSRHGSYYEVGVRFDESDEVFTARMVEQVCEIEHYRNEVLRSEGRVLDSETAAKEWVSLYAAQYPSGGGH
ncbi:MAG: PilZ domain-containing protein [Candidatus Accumulibacter sp. UW26]|jgi:hypothetical protein